MAQPVGMQAGLRSSIVGAPGRESESRTGAREVAEVGADIVAALFEGFQLIHGRRTTRPLEIAGAGGHETNRALLDAIAGEAAKSASHVLQMCIRAIDYCPPVDVTCRDLLRALLTADADLFGDDVVSSPAGEIGQWRSSLGPGTCCANARNGTGCPRKRSG